MLLLKVSRSLLYLRCISRETVPQCHHLLYINLWIFECELCQIFEKIQNLEGACGWDIQAGDCLNTSIASSMIRCEFPLGI